MGLFDRLKSNRHKTPQQRKENSIKLLKESGIKVFEGLPVIEGYEEAKTRTKDEIVQRAVALCIVSVYAEGFLSDTPIKENQDFVAPIIEKYNATGFFTEKEKAFLENENPLPQDAINFSWQYECYNVLLWALGFSKNLSFPGEICDVSGLVKILAATPSFEKFYKNSKLRDKEEILDEADLIYRYDWACVDARINGLDIDKLNSGVVLERHRALNWLINYMEQEWDNISTDT